MASELLGTSEVAEILGISRSTVNRRAALGTLPVAMKLPGPLGVNLFDRADIEAMKEAKSA